MKYLLFTIVFYVALISSAKAQTPGDGKELKEKTVQYGAVGIGTTIVEKAKIGLGQERIAHIKAKYATEKAALKIAIKEGKTTVIKAKEKITLAKESLERDKKQNKVSERVYLARKERLEMIEQKTKALEEILIKN